MQKRRKVGIIGYGDLGQAMARLFVGLPWDVRIYDTTVNWDKIRLPDNQYGYNYRGRAGRFVRSIMNNCDVVILCTGQQEADKARRWLTKPRVIGRAPLQSALQRT